MTPAVWYFAYGSNLSVDRIERRTQETHAAQLAYLDGYRFAFNQRGPDGRTHANIVPSPGSRVWGAVYRCSATAIDRLDHFEGVAEGQYERRRVEVVSDGVAVLAEVYIAGPTCTGSAGKPTPEYLGHILTGARRHGLPEDHIREIERLANL